MADAAGRCLSDLTDDLLRHILSFLPASARAATAVLSRRWLRLWRTSGDVYLDSRSFIAGCSSAEQESEAFLHGAEKVLAATAALGPIKRLTIYIAENSKIIPLKQSWSQWEQKMITEHNLMEDLISNPAARQVEELQIEVKPSDTPSMFSFRSLPSETLQVLRIFQCSALTAALPPGATMFPKLVDLQVQHCGLPLVDLQSIIDAAPRLSTLHLASCYLNTETNYTNEVVVGRLLMPAVSDLVLADCTYRYRNSRLELDVPNLQFFRYKGPVLHTNRLLLKSQASTTHVDLHLTQGRIYGYDYGYNNGQNPPVCELFWRFIQNFNTTKHLKVRIENYYTMDDLALIDEASRDELLGGLSFSLVEQLELEAEYKPFGETSMVMLADLLRCFPMVRDLRIKLTIQNRHEYIRGESPKDREARVHFDTSVSAFRNHRRRRSMVSLAPQNDDNYDALDIPGLTGEHSFNCLQSHVKRVSLQFFKDDPNCLGVQLAKFFAQNAMVLQELHIDDGCQEMLEHMNFSLPRWIANTNNANNQLVVKD